MKVSSEQRETCPLPRIPYEMLVYSSRVRLARNLRGFPFPGWANTHARATVWAKVVHAVAAVPLLEDPCSRAMGELDGLSRTLLQERRLISAELASGDATSGVVYEQSGRLSVMVNEEDHLRLQGVASGFALPTAWEAVVRLHAGLAAQLDFAFSPRYGYLTACPSNVGTGIRASVMVHLAGLRLAGELDAVVRGLERTGFAVRGISGEGSSALGGFCQISNQRTLGVREDETLSAVAEMVETVLQAEYAVRARLSTVRPLVLEDAVARAYAVLRYARLLTTGEALDLLSAILLGLDRGMITGVGLVTLQELVRDVQPGHMQFRYGKTLAAGDRDRYRATLVRQALAAMELV